eukprot:6465412-Amphidinium_carterae.1
MPYDHPDYSLKYLTRCIERKIRVDNVHRQRSEVQASLRSRGLALPAGVTDDTAGGSTGEGGNGGHAHHEMMDDNMYAVPGFTGKSPPRSPIRQNQQKGSRKSTRGSDSPKEKPRKSSTSPRDDKGSKPDARWRQERM